MLYSILPSRNCRLLQRLSPSPLNRPLTTQWRLKLFLGRRRSVASALVGSVLVVVLGILAVVVEFPEHLVYCLSTELVV